jgi:hypothetical protein
MTSVGEIIVAGDNSAPTRLPIGSVGQVITSNGISPVWAAGGSSYSLPIATTATLGGIKPDGISIIVDQNTGVATAVGGYGIAGWVPSSGYIDITPGVSGDTYTAPANG